MRSNDRSKLLLEFSLAASLLLLLPAPGRGQEPSKATPAALPAAGTPADVQALAQAVRELQAQVQVLHAQMTQLRADEQQAEARDLRRELHLARTQPPSPSLMGTSYQLPATAAISEPPPSAAPGSKTAKPAADSLEQANSERIGKLEEDEQLTEGKLKDQYQTKVESGSKYKLKLSGMVLMNVFSNRKSFDPHVLLIQAGSTVQFPNKDPFFHNVFSLFDGKRFDLGLYEGGSSNSVRFDRPGVSFLSCNIHPEISAVVVVVDTSYFALSDHAGRVVVANVPDGSYLMHVWYERSSAEELKALERVVTISDSTRSLESLQVIDTGDFKLAHKNKYGLDYTPQTNPAYKRP